MTKLACLALLFAAPAFAVHAQVVTPNPTPTIIKTAPYMISKSGYYQLGADLVYAGNGNPNDAIITIAASNVTLDFAGHYISGPSANTATTLFGVYANEEGNLNILNGTVAFCWIGVYLTGDNQSSSLNINQRINNMLVTHCYYTGIAAEFVTNSDVNNNRVSIIGGSTSSKGIATCYGIFCDGNGIRASGNSVTAVTPASGGTGYGIFSATFAFNNQVSNCGTGIYGGVYQQNLTSGCTTAYSSGTNAGLNSP